jgi:hypothetical protein
MSKIIRPHNDDGDTHLFDGVSVGGIAHVFFLVFFSGFGAFLFIWLIQYLIWWALRLHFLAQSDEVLATYHIDDPRKQRLHARLSGFCLLLVVVFAALTYYDWVNPNLHKEWLWPFATGISGGVYVFLTAIFYLNRRDDPVAHCWD